MSPSSTPWLGCLAKRSSLYFVASSRGRSILILRGTQKELAFEKLLDRLEPLDRVCSIAKQYHDVLPMAVASGGIRRIIDAQLIQINLQHLFKVRVTAEDTERHKPEPDVFLEAARQLDVDPRRCLVFEDSPLGFEAAFKAGMGWVDVRVPVNKFAIQTQR